MSAAFTGDRAVKARFRFAVLLAGDGGVQRRRGLDALYLGQELQHDVLDEIHVMAVICHLDPDWPIEDTPRFQHLGNALKRNRVAG